jgi:transcriptional regulator with XRE-family HTH domain
MEDKIILQKLGQRIRLLREQKNVSQQELAFLCDFEKSNMSRIEAGRTNPTFLTLLKICSALSIKLSELLTFEELENLEKKL